jgi:hypothetical protein
LAFSFADHKKGTGKKLKGGAFTHPDTICGHVTCGRTPLPHPPDLNLLYAVHSYLIFRAGDGSIVAARMAVFGTLLEVNERVQSRPELLNSSSCLESGWCPRPVFVTALQACNVDQTLPLLAFVTRRFCHASLLSRVSPMRRMACHHQAEQDAGAAKKAEEEGMVRKKVCSESLSALVV